MNVRAFVIGNAAWDETLHLAALPAPGASAHVRHGVAGPGGKGLNQAVVLARAGLDVTLVAPIGTDARGDALAAAMAGEGLMAGLPRLPEVATDWSAILLADSGENVILTTHAAADALDARDAVAALATASPGDLCLAQGNLSFATTYPVIVAARDRGMFVALNPSPVQPSFRRFFSDCDAVFLNRDEARDFTRNFGSKHLTGFGSRYVVLTLGAAGATLISAAGRESVAAAPALAIDPTGAGDTFLAATLAHAAPRGWRLDRAALEAGAQAAALTVARRGAFAALPTRSELAAIIGPR